MNVAVVVDCMAVIAWHDQNLKSFMIKQERLLIELFGCFYEHVSKQGLLVHTFYDISRTVRVL